MIATLNNILWKGPLLFLLFVVGGYLSYRLRFIQIRELGTALKLVFCPQKQTNEQKTGDVSSFQSLMTALAGSIGTGNVTGIAVAITIGGAGSIFWMWVVAFLGMATAYAESVLAIRYREVNAEGHITGGPVQTLRNGLGMPRLAMTFAVLAAIAAFGYAMVQANSVVDAVSMLFPVEKTMAGLVLAVITAAVLLGGIASIARVASVLVPFMAVLYILAGLIVLVYHLPTVPAAFALIVKSAFTGHAATGGFMGAGAWLAIERGFANGIFANEAGLGSLAIAASTAKAQSPAKQGLFAISGVFISTMIVCTITGLVLVVTNVLGSVDANGQLITGSPLALMAFGSVYEPTRYMVLVGLVLFAFTTILAWAYYGEKCAESLFGLKFAKTYRLIYTAMVFLGACIDLYLVWSLAMLANGLMVIPNLISVFGLANEVVEENAEYHAFAHQ